MNGAMETFTIHIPDELARELEKLSAQENRAVDDLVRDSLQRYVAIQRFKQLSKAVRPYAQSQGFFADDDVYKRAIRIC